MRRLVFAAFLASVSTAAFAAPPACSMEGFSRWPHPTDLESLPRDEWPKPRGGETCMVRSSSTRASGGKAYRFTFATIRMQPGERPLGAFVGIGRLDGEAETTLGRFALPIEFVEGRAGTIDLQAVEREGKVFVSLSRSEAELFVIAGDVAERLPNAGWYGELARFLTPRDAMGRILRFDLEAMSGLVALHDARADDPARPASIFAPRRAILAELEWHEGRLAIKAARQISGADVIALDPDDEADAPSEDIRRRIGALPKGVEPCWLSVWAADKDLKGLNVRAEPSAKAAILGQLPPPSKDPDVGEVLAKELLIIGYRDGWFLIDTKIGEDEDGAAKAGPKRWFGGRGWINARMVSANTAHSGLGEHKLFAAPTPKAHWTIGRQRNGDPMTGDSAIARIHACSWDWTLVDSENGQRGWRRRLCSNQLTTCP